MVKTEEDASHIVAKANAMRPTLTAYAFGILSDWSLAEDAVQEGLISLSGEIDRYDRSKALFPWIKAIVRNRCFIKINERKREVFMSTPELETKYESALFELWDEEAADRFEAYLPILKKCIGELPEKSQAYLREMYREKKTSHSVATDEKRSPRGLRVTMFRMRKRIRKCLQDKVGLKQNEDQENCFIEIDQFYDQSLTRNEEKRFLEDLYEKESTRAAMWEYLVLEAVLYRTLVVEKRQEAVADSRKAVRFANGVFRSTIGSMAAIMVLGVFLGM